MVTMAERMAKLEVKVENIEINLCDLKDESAKNHAEIIILLQGLEKKFANKWVEKVSISLLVSIIGGVAVMLVIAGAKFLTK